MVTKRRIAPSFDVIVTHDRSTFKRSIQKRSCEWLISTLENTASIVRRM